MAPESMIYITPVLKDSSLAAHQEKDWVQDSALDFQNACKDVPLYNLRELFSQTSQYKDSKIKH